MFSGCLLLIVCALVPFALSAKKSKQPEVDYTPLENSIGNCEVFVTTDIEDDKGKHAVMDIKLHHLMNLTEGDGFDTFLLGLDREDIMTNISRVNLTQHAITRTSITKTQFILDRTYDSVCNFTKLLPGIMVDGRRTQPMYTSANCSIYHSHYNHIVIHDNDGKVVPLNKLSQLTLCTDYAYLHGGTISPDGEFGPGERHWHITIMINNGTNDPEPSPEIIEEVRLQQLLNERWGALEERRWSYVESSREPNETHVEKYRSTDTSGELDDNRTRPDLGKYRGDFNRVDGFGRG